MPATHTQRRLTKHELKEDSLTTAVFRAKEWVQKNFKLATIAAGAVVVVVAGVWGFFAWRQSGAREALSLYGEAGVEMRSGNPAVAIAQLQKLLDEHAGAEVAGPACFQLAQLHFRQRNFDDARAAFQRYLNDYGDDPLLKAASWAGQAAVDEQAGFHNEAMQKYQNAYQTDPKGFRAPEYLRKVIRTAIAANDTTAALAALATIEKDFPKDTENAKIARQSLVEHGYIDPANAVR